jgi:hypothetical protein
VYFFCFFLTVITNKILWYSFHNSQREKSRVVYDLWKTANSGDSEAKKFYIQSLQEHLVLLDKQIKDASTKIINLSDKIEEKEKDKDKIERNKIVEKSKKRKLKQLIPSFASDGNAKKNNQVTCVTKETLCVKNNTVKLLSSGNDSSDNDDDDDDDDELLKYNLKPSSK